MNSKAVGVILGLIVLGFVLLSEEIGTDSVQAEPPAPVAPQWAAITTWPPVDAKVVDPVPDPNRRITAVILDDSGSMGDDIVAAKTAVTEALGAMKPDDRVAVIALNAGVLLPFTFVAEAQQDLPVVLNPIYSDGSTPLTNAVQTAQVMLEREAAFAQSFGTYRIIVTTDGIADDEAALAAAVELMAAQTPVQLATIGIGISGGHVLRRSDLASFVDISDVSALSAALAEAVAENTDFDAVTSFEGGSADGAQN